MGILVAVAVVAIGHGTQVRRAVVSVGSGQRMGHDVRVGLLLDRRDALFPVGVRLKAEAATGWLLVGPRPDGSMPSSDEREVLSKIAKPVARSVAITRTREARAGEHRRTIGLLHDAVAELRARMERLDAGTVLSGTG